MYNIFIFEANGNKLGSLDNINNDRNNHMEECHNPCNKDEKGTKRVSSPYASEKPVDFIKLINNQKQKENDTFKLKEKNCMDQINNVRKNKKDVYANINENANIDSIENVKREMT